MSELEQLAIDPTQPQFQPLFAKAPFRWQGDTGVLNWCQSLYNMGQSTPPPTIGTLSPATTVHGGVAFTLTVNGTLFVSGATVLWGGGARVTTFVSATQLTAAITAADIALSGTVAVTVKNPDTGVSNASNFTIT
jgi:hypothetical protein